MVQHSGDRLILAGQRGNACLPWVRSSARPGASTSRKDPSPALEREGREAARRGWWVPWPRPWAFPRVTLVLILPNISWVTDRRSCSEGACYSVHQKMLFIISSLNSLLKIFMELVRSSGVVNSQISLLQYMGLHPQFVQSLSNRRAAQVNQC